MLADTQLFNRNEFVNKFEKISRFFVLFLLSVYTFSLFAFSARPLLNYIHILISLVLGVSCLIYSVLFGRLKFDIFSFLLICFCFVIIVSAIVNNAFEYINKSVFLNVCLAVGLYQFFLNKKGLYGILLSFLIGSCFFYVYYILHYKAEIFSLSFLKDSLRLGEYFNNQNEIGKAFTVTGFVALFLSFSFKKPYFSIISLISLFLLLTTGSISNLLVFACLAVLYLMLHFRKKGRIVTVLSLLFLAIFGFFLLQLPFMKYFKERFIGIFITFFSGGSVVEDGSAASRLEYALDGFKIFFSSPLFGVGPNGMIRFLTGRYSHNTLSELAGDFGILGLILFESLLLLPIFKIKRANKQQKLFTICIVFFLFFFQFFLVTFSSKLEYLLLSVLYGQISQNLSTYFQLEFSFKNHKKRIFTYNKVVCMNRDKFWL